MLRSLQNDSSGSSKCSSRWHRHHVWGQKEVQLHMRHTLNHNTKKQEWAGQPVCLNWCWLWETLHPNASTKNRGKKWLFFFFAFITAWAWDLDGRHVLGLFKCSWSEKKSNKLHCLDISASLWKRLQRRRTRWQWCTFCACASIHWYVWVLETEDRLTALTPLSFNPHRGHNSPYAGVHVCA